MSHKTTNQSVNFVQLSQPMNMSHDVRKFLTVETSVRKTFMKYHAQLICKCITASFKCLKISFEYFSSNRSRTGNSTQQSCQDGSCRFTCVALHKHKLFLEENFLMEAVTHKVSFQTVWRYSQNQIHTIKFWTQYVINCRSEVNWNQTVKLAVN